ncbi:MAG: HipA N-terminal domain-containing protein [Bacteroides sp.]|nr:HipA N-terminal domain-containing protein [Eubacterium sp.]MCM1418189.1 HipA N-terminal domain-containing protein [Roseburia sp.]MCM1462286.1 HipA N-terminal domain-containing protein [Bacteroides sp.]
MNKTLNIFWQEPQRHQRFQIGTLSYDGSCYLFQYVKDFSRLEEKGFIEILPFLDRNKIYKSKEMFAVFLSRLPDRKQIGIERILQKYGLTEYDAFELLARSGGRVPGDTMEFIVPINRESKKPIQFFIAGVSHGSFCELSETYGQCGLIPTGSLLEYKTEPENDYDENAIVLLWKGKKVGYIPFYYSKDFSDMIKAGNELIIRAISHVKKSCCDKNDQCQTCIAIEVSIKQ